MGLTDTPKKVWEKEKRGSNNRIPIRTMVIALLKEPVIEENCRVIFFANKHLSVNSDTTKETT